MRARVHLVAGAPSFGQLARENKRPLAAMCSPLTGGAFRLREFALPMVVNNSSRVWPRAVVDSLVGSCCLARLATPLEFIWTKSLSGANYWSRQQQQQLQHRTSTTQYERRRRNRNFPITKQLNAPGPQRYEQLSEAEACQRADARRLSGELPLGCDRVEPSLPVGPTRAQSSYKSNSRGGRSRRRRQLN